MKQQNSNQVRSTIAALFLGITAVLTLLILLQALLKCLVLLALYDDGEIDCRWVAILVCLEFKVNGVELN